MLATPTKLGWGYDDLLPSQGAPKDGPPSCPPPALLLAGRIRLDPGIDMIDHPLEWDIDSGMALMRLCGHRGQLLAAVVAEGQSTDTEAGKSCM